MGIVPSRRRQRDDVARLSDLVNHPARLLEYESAEVGTETEAHRSSH